MQNRLRITELKHEMSNIHVTKMQSQLKSFIKVSRWEVFETFVSLIYFLAF